MTVVPSADNLIVESSGLPLALYAQRILFSECAFWGVYNPADPVGSCDKIWLKQDRDMVAYYLGEAQVEIEQVAGFPLSPKWYTDEEHEFLPYIMADWGKVIAAGVRAEEDVSLGEAVDHTADPAVVGPVATTVTDENELHIYHPGTDAEIFPSAVTLAGGFVTFEIPRCRMVLAALADNDENGVMYSDDANFEQTVDIVRVYNDDSTNAQYVWFGSTSYCTCPSCTENSETACLTLRNALFGSFGHHRATYTDGAWVASTCRCKRTPVKVLINYYAGQQVMTSQMQDAIIRLAHSKMPVSPCGCETANNLWKRDRNTPEVLTAERLNCPFGLSDGAWAAYQFAKSLRIVMAAAL